MKLLWIVVDCARCYIFLVKLIVSDHCGKPVKPAAFFGQINWEFSWSSFLPKTHCSSESLESKHTLRHFYKSSVWETSLYRWGRLLYFWLSFPVIRSMNFEEAQWATSFTFWSLCFQHLVCLLVCAQDYLKTYKQIFMKLSGNVGAVRKDKWLNFGGGLDQHLDPGFLKLFFLSVCAHDVTSNPRVLAKVCTLRVLLVINNF